MRHPASGSARHLIPVFSPAAHRTRGRGLEDLLLVSGSVSTAQQLKLRIRVRCQFLISYRGLYIPHSRSLRPFPGWTSQFSGPFLAPWQDRP